MGDSATNGLLDIMRGISTIASMVIVGRTVANAAEDLFRHECDKCCGTGKVTCARCNGSKLLAKRPAQLVPGLARMNRRHEDLYECFICGPTTDHDNLGPGGDEEDMNEADRIKDAVRNAVRNKPTSSRPLAGTVACPECRGQCHYWHFIPNVAKLFGLEEPWHEKPMRKGATDWVPLGQHRHGATYREWPGRPTQPISQDLVDYFEDDAFDYKDKMVMALQAEMREDMTLDKGSASKEPDDLEDYQFTTVQELTKTNRKKLGKGKKDVAPTGGLN